MFIDEGLHRNVNPFTFLRCVVIAHGWENQTICLATEAQETDELWVYECELASGVQHCVGRHSHSIWTDHSKQYDLQEDSARVLGLGSGGTRGSWGRRIRYCGYVGCCLAFRFTHVKLWGMQECVVECAACNHSAPEGAGARVCWMFVTPEAVRAQWLAQWLAMLACLLMKSIKSASVGNR